MSIGFGIVGMFGMLAMVLFWVGLIVLAVWAGGALFGSRSTDPQIRSGGSPSPLEIIEQRCARGEIDRETYEQLKRDLK